MEKNNKYYSLIKEFVKQHRKFPGYEPILEDIIDDVYAHSEIIINTITDERVIKAYIEKVVSTSIITVPRKLNFNKAEAKASNRVPAIPAAKDVYTEVSFPDKNAHTEYIDNMINSTAKEVIDDALGQNKEIIEQENVETLDNVETESESLELAAEDADNEQTEDIAFDEEEPTFAFEAPRADDETKSESLELVSEDTVSEQTEDITFCEEEPAFDFEAPTADAETESESLEIAPEDTDNEQTEDIAFDEEEPAFDFEAPTADADTESESLEIAPEDTVSEQTEGIAFDEEEPAFDFEAPTADAETESESLELASEDTVNEQTEDITFCEEEPAFELEAPTADVEPAPDRLDLAVDNADNNTVFDIETPLMSSEAESLDLVAENADNDLVDDITSGDNVQAFDIETPMIDAEVGNEGFDLAIDENNESISDHLSLDNNEEAFNSESLLPAENDSDIALDNDGTLDTFGSFSEDSLEEDSLLPNDNFLGIEDNEDLTQVASGDLLEEDSFGDVMPIDDGGDTIESFGMDDSVNEFLQPASSVEENSFAPAEESVPASVDTNIYDVFEYTPDTITFSDSEKQELLNDLSNLAHKNAELNILNVYDLKYNKNYNIVKISEELSMQEKDVIKALNIITGIV